MYHRELGVPWPVGTQFKRFGAPSHQRRLVNLDVIVRSHVSDPQIERYVDDSVRYNVAPRKHPVLLAIKADKALADYVFADDKWMLLLSPICIACLRPFNEHSRSGKCLFEATTWTELVVPEGFINQRRTNPLIDGEE